MAEETNTINKFVLSILGSAALSALITGIFTTCNSEAKYVALQNHCDVVKAELKDYKDRENRWRFSAPLYRKIPGDIDFPDSIGLSGKPMGLRG